MQRNRYTPNQLIGFSINSLEEREKPCSWSSLGIGRGSRIPSAGLGRQPQLSPLPLSLCVWAVRVGLAAPQEVDRGEGGGERDEVGGGGEGKDGAHVCDDGPPQVGQVRPCPRASETVEEGGGRFFGPPPTCVSL